MREIPSLQILCLRAVGSKACSAEVTFAKTADGQPSMSSRLLRSFHQRKLSSSPNGNNEEKENVDSAIALIPIERIPAIGQGSARREQQGEVDLNHPWIGMKQNDGTLLMDHGNSALDVLQALIDSLVELGRMDDTRLGLHFFQEWKANVEAAADANNAKTSDTDTTAKTTPPKKRRKSNSNSTVPDNSILPALGSLSLHNTILMEETIEAMVESKMGNQLAVLDLTGVQTLNDDMFAQVITRAPHLQRLSVKNCRRLTNKSLLSLSEYSTNLYSVDVGGSYNLSPTSVIDMVANLSNLMELHASGLGWTDALVEELTSLRSWKGLSLGFSIYLSEPGIKQAIANVGQSLESLALPFCEHFVDAALLGYMGRHLPRLQYLDVRGNGNLSSLTGWYDGRATIVPVVPPQPLLVLARYSGISASSLEDTKRIHPLEAVQLTCILGSGGAGKGIRRVET